MAQAYLIMRLSIFTFLKNYNYFTSTPALLLLPFAVSALVSPSLVSSSSLLSSVRGYLRSLFPPSSHLLNFIHLKFSHTILTSLFLTPFSYSSLLLAKAAIIRALHHENQTEIHWIQLFTPILITQLCNSLVILSANMMCFVFLALSSPLPLLLSAIGAMIFSIICNLALVWSATEERGGFIAIQKACVLIKGRSATALSLVMSVNLSSAAIEALFQYRIVGDFNRAHSSILLEGMLIAYLYAATLILDTVVGYMFWRSCKTDNRIVHVHVPDQKC